MEGEEGCGRQRKGTSNENALPHTTKVTLALDKGIRCVESWYHWGEGAESGLRNPM